MRFIGLWAGLLIGLAHPVWAQFDAPASVFRTINASNELAVAGDYGGALALLRDALDETSLTAVEFALLSGSLASTYQGANDPANARKHYLAALEKSANLDAAHQNRLWRGLATTALQQGDHKDVVAIIGQWRERVAEPSPDVHQLLAYAHFQLGDQNLAIVEGERYADLLRNAGETIPASFARFLERVRRPQGEASDLPTSELSGLAGPNTLALLVRANEMIEGQRHAAAAKLLGDAIDKGGATETEVALLREKLAWALGYQKEMEGARDQFRAITEAPGDLPKEMLDKVWMRLAAANYSARAYDETLRTAEAWKARLGEPTAYYFLLTSMAHWHLENRDLAMTQGRRYIELARQKGEEIRPSFKALFKDALGKELSDD